MSLHDGAALAEPQIINATEAFLEHLRRHDRRADGQHNPTVESIHCAPEKPEVHRGCAPDCRAIEHRMIGNDVVTDAGMGSEWNLAFECLRHNRGFLPGMLSVEPAACQFM